MLSFYKNVFSSLAVNGISMVLIFIASVFLTRALGVEGRGVATWITSLNAIGSIFAQGGMVFASRKFAAMSPQRSGDIIIITFLICIIASIIIIPAFLLMDIPPAVKENPVALMFGIMTIPFVAMAQCYGSMIIGLDKKKVFNSLPLLQGGGQAAIVFAVIYMGIVTPLYAVIALIVPAFLRMAASLWAMRGYISFKLKEPAWIFKHLKSFIFFNYISSLFLLMINALPPLLTGSLSTLHEAGLFAACIPFIEALYRVPSMLSAHSVTNIINEKDLQKKMLFKNRIMIHTFIFMSLIAVFLFFIANWMIVSIYGENFKSSVAIFQMLLPGTVFAATFNIAQSFIVVEDKSWKIAVAPALAALILIAGSIILVPEYGAVGAAFVWSVSCFVATAFAWLILRRI